MFLHGAGKVLFLCMSNAFLEKLIEKFCRKEEKRMEKEKKHTLEDIIQEKKREMQLDEAFELSNSASFTDCTGSVPAAPVTKEQWNNYDEAYHFQPKTVTTQKK